MAVLSLSFLVGNSYAAGALKDVRCQDELTVFEVTHALDQSTKAVAEISLIQGSLPFDGSHLWLKAYQNDVKLSLTTYETIDGGIIEIKEKSIMPYGACRTRLCDSEMKRVTLIHTSKLGITQTYPCQII